MISKSKRKLVEKGYDKIAKNYLKQLRSNSDANQDTIKYLNLLIKYLPEKAKVLDLGCGAGVPATKILAQHYQVTGVDISAKQLELAQQNVPSATFIQSDILNLNFQLNSFDAIVSLYTIFHIPRKYHSQIIAKIHNFLKPGGYLLVTMGTENMAEIVADNWLGGPTYWSFFDTKTNLKMVKQAGFKIITSKVETEKETTGTSQHLYILAQKPKRAR